MKKLDRPEADVIIKRHLYNIDHRGQEMAEKFIRGEYDMGLSELAEQIFDKKIHDDPHEMKNLKNLLLDLKKQKIFGIDDSQRRFIEQNCKRMKPYEMARELYPDNNIKTNSSEQKGIKLYLEAIGKDKEYSRQADLEYKAKIAGRVVEEDDDDDNYSTYSPPRQLSSAVRRINDAVPNVKYAVHGLKPGEKKEVEALMSYLKTRRFVETANNIPSEGMRRLFESTFIQATYDKPDLNSEELNMYINLCDDYIIGYQLQKQMNLLDEQLNDVLGDDEETTKLRMSIVEMHSNIRDDYNKCKARQQKLQESVSGQRSKRIDQQVARNQSITDLMSLWKTEESRLQQIRVAQARVEMLKKEKTRIEGLDEFYGSMFGIHDEELFDQ